MKPPGFFRKLASHFREEVLETVESTVSGRLEVWLAFGHLELNTPNVNYSYGSLDTVFREAFAQLQDKIPKSGKVLLLGMGAGNVPRILSGIGRYGITGVDLDPEVIRLGRKYFGLDEIAGLEWVIADAMEYVHMTNETWDLVIVDLFVDDKVPDGAEQHGFLQKLPRLLRPKGLLLFNRLMHTEELAVATEGFTQSIQKIIPGTRYIKAHKNRMLVYEKG